MNKQTYILNRNWVLLTDGLPREATRVLLTNGDSILIGILLTVENSVAHWVYDRTTVADYNPIAWMDLPQINITSE